MGADAGDFGTELGGAGGDVGVEAPDEAENLGGFFGHQGFEGGGIEILQGILQEGGEEGLDEVGKVGACLGFEAGETGEGGVALGDGVFEVCGFAEPLLVAGFVPAGEDGGCDAVVLAGEGADADDDFAIVHAFAQGEVDHFADLTGEAGNVGAWAVWVLGEAHPVGNGGVVFGGFGVVLGLGGMGGMGRMGGMGTHG